MADPEPMVIRTSVRDRLNQDAELKALKVRFEGRPAVAVSFTDRGLGFVYMGQDASDPNAAARRNQPGEVDKRRIELFIAVGKEGAIGEDVEDDLSRIAHAIERVVASDQTHGLPGGAITEHVITTPALDGDGSLLVGTRICVFHVNYLRCY